ncbi:MAG: twin-arginine translocase TatA/TatE family subunit [Deltaproteobacteria bacterium]|nr:twin-arginine translocase TatA/TatE family subunit [Deltaproteobacteria bacterium]
MGLGWSEILLLGLLALLIFGKDLPQVARDCGRFLNELKRSIEGIF